MDYTDVPKIVVCGDSISAGVIYDESEKKYVKTDKSYVLLMAERLNAIIKNISKFGNTVATAMPRLAKNLEAEKPDVVLIELGGNDCNYKWQSVADNPKAEHLPATDIVTFKNTLVTLAATLKSRSIQAVFSTLPPLDPDRYFKWISKSSVETAAHILEWLGSVSRIYWWQEMYNNAIIKVANETSSPLIDLRSGFLSTPDFRKYICCDGIHPSVEGHKIICSTVSNFVAANYPTLIKESLVPAVSSR